jgi:hypothetical protein
VRTGDNASQKIADQWRNLEAGGYGTEDEGKA